MSKRRTYLPEFKQEAVELTRMEGVTISQIARDLGIGANMLSRWCREQEQDGTKAFRGQGKARITSRAAFTGWRFLRMCPDSKPQVKSGKR